MEIPTEALSSSKHSEVGEHGRKTKSKQHFVFQLPTARTGELREISPRLTEWREISQPKKPGGGQERKENAQSPKQLTFWLLSRERFLKVWKSGRVAVKHKGRGKDYR